MRGLITAAGNLVYYNLNQTWSKHQSFPSYKVLICFLIANVHSTSIRSKYSTQEIYKCDFDSSDCAGSFKAGDSKLFDILPSYLTFKPSYYRITDFSSISKIFNSSSCKFNEINKCIDF